MKIDRGQQRGHLTITGQMSAHELLAHLESALARAVGEGLRTLIVDLLQVRLTSALPVLALHEAGTRLARAGIGLHLVALVTTEECARDNEFLFTVAGNRGLRVAAFVDEAQARRWLDA